MKNAFKRYFPYMKNYMFYYFIIFIGILLTVSSTIATAQIVQPMMDDMFIAKDESQLIIIPLTFIAIFFAKSIGRYLQSVYMNYIGLHIVSHLREDLLRKMLYMDMKFQFSNRSGELISRVTNDISRVQYFVSNMFPELLRESLTAIGLVGYVIWLNPMLAFYSLVAMPIAVYPLILIAKRLKRLAHRSQEKNADVVTRLTEVFNNNEVIKANSTEEYEMTRFSNENWHFFKLTMKSVYTNEIVSPLMEIFGVIGLAFVIYMGGRDVIDGVMTPGQFMAFFTAVGLSFQPVRRVSSIYGKIQDATAATERIFEVLDAKAAITDGDLELTEDIHSIEFKNVSLNYDKKTALSQIDLKVHSGQNIALVGDSGGGKSSLINLLLRFYEINEGELYINKKTISSFTQESLRSHISVVSQRIYIFQDSLCANVAYGQDIDEERVYEALKLADASEFVNSLEEGIHTQMAEAGTNLSGGQRQRIAIARAIYKHASLLIFDEATSALDNESEKRIQKAIESYTKDKITFTIAHRLSTIEHADLILVFQKGKIVSRGTHNELIKSSAHYQSLAGSLQ
ncbi:ABC transporter ATP-binding protein [Sulfurimonas sp. MAG313]|nr:ABC transporter ATP-binding protein [Sulfurimonas sp. MAG313]MDF1882079.1 ABC transporter ATP-binding protein [Sulfurimonas sp. MAG313]